MVPLMQKEMSGTLTLFDLFAQHNEHRIPFARMAMLSIGKFTQYNTVSEMIFSWIILCLTGLLIFYIYWGKFSHNSHHKRLLYFLPVSLLLFSFRQYESILMGFTCHIYLMIFGVVATIFLLDASKKMDAWFVLSFLCAILSSYSFVVGLLVWPVGVLQLLLSQRRIEWRKLALWCFMGVLVFTLYFWGYTKPSGHPSLDYVTEHPVATGRYFLTLIGAPLSHEVVTAAAFGLVMTFLAMSIIIYVLKGRLLSRHGVWFSLIFFITLCSIATTIGRAGLGIDQALATRYIPVTALGIIGLYLLALAVTEKSSAKSRNFGAHAMLTLILVGLVASYGVGWYEGYQSHNSREIGAYVLSTHKIQSDENIRKYLFPNPEYVKKHVQFLEENKLNVFNKVTFDTSKLSLIHSNTLFSIDSINDEIISPNAPPMVINSTVQKTINITGWTVDKQANDVASAIFIVFNDDLEIPTYYGLDRSDISQRLNNSRFRFSGFVATFSSSTLEKGEGTFFMIIVGNDGESYYRTDKQTFFVIE